MARQLRVEYPGAIYHVINRGDRREPIFQDDQDYLEFLRVLSEACCRTTWQVHAYVLMPNHFHLVLETPNANLVAGMKWMLGTYTSRFNRRHQLFGHLFSGRYKALIVDGSDSGYLKTVCDYVHLNPSRAKLLKPDQPLRTFVWSSWPEYLKAPAKRPPWLRVDRLMGEHGIPKDSPAGRRELERRVETTRAAENGEDYKPIRRGWCLGEKKFREELLEQMTERRGLGHGGEEIRASEEQHAEQIVSRELSRRRWDEKELEKRPKNDPGKAKIAQRLRRETTMTYRWTAERLQMGSESTVKRSLRKLDKAS
jgi:REP element-mobilizing transposase RayT